MISQLGNLDPAHLGVIARTSVMHYKHSQESIPQIGKDLGVQYVIEGSVRRDSERVRITAQLIQVKDQSHLWAREYDRDLGHLLELQAEIAREVANEIEFSLSGRRPIGSEAGASAAVGTSRASFGTSYEAYDLLSERPLFLEQKDFGRISTGGRLLSAGDRKGSEFWPRLRGSGRHFRLESTWYIGPQNELMPKARPRPCGRWNSTRVSPRRTPRWRLIKENYDYDWPGAENEFRMAIQLDSQYATAHQWYAEFLSWQGRFDEAIAESERARQLDPLSLIIAATTQRSCITRGNTTAP